MVLASASPRRRHLLEMLGIPHVVHPADVDETRLPGEVPEAMAVRLATAKASAVHVRRPDDLVLAADTVVIIDDQVLGKPAYPADAERMLALLSGRSHRVVTGVALVVPGGDVRERYDVTHVWFRELSADLIRSYVATGEPLDKAGSYGVQGVGAVLVERVDGDFFSVMGLPLRLVVELLEEAGRPYRFTR
jgi:septum formation protein